MDAPWLISDFATNGSYKVTRRARAAPVNGKYVPGIATTFNITASIQPATGRDLLRLPEGRRVLETRVIYTVTKLSAGGQYSPNEADMVLIDGAPWEIQAVAQWAQQNETETFFRCIAQTSSV